MIGTEKQATWAEAIKSDLLPEIDEVAEIYAHQFDANNGTEWNEFCENAGEYGIGISSVNAYQQNISYHHRFDIAVTAIRECQSAKWFIDFGRYGAECAIKNSMGMSGTRGARLIG